MRRPWRSFVHWEDIANQETVITGCKVHYYPLCAENAGGNPKHGCTQETGRCILGKRRKETKEEVRDRGPWRRELRDEQENEDEHVQEAEESLYSIT